MPDTLVVDTNVILVANNKHREVSPECVANCALRLQDVMNSGRLALDDARRILGEYLHKTHPNRSKGPGDAFVKWVLRNEHNLMRCVRVALTETSKDQFQGFPQDGELENFDPPDRKFVAVAIAHPENPPILQATDSKWLGWAEELARHGITVEFVCEKDVRRFQKRKFPDG